MAAGVHCFVSDSNDRAFRSVAAIFTLASLWNVMITPTCARELLCSNDGGEGTSKGTLPSMLIGIGAQKAGSSMLYSALSQHPQIVASRSKEVHFFSTYQVLGHSLDAYLQNWDDWDTRLNQTRGGVLFEFTPRYLATSFTPCRIRRILPDAKFIVTLREPIARAFSALNMNRGYTYLDSKKGQAKENECARFAPWDSVVNASLAAIQASGDACIGSGLASELAWKDCGVIPLNPIARGLYAAQISWWFRHFHPFQFIFVNADDLKRDTVGELNRIIAFAGLSPLFSENGQLQLNMTEIRQKKGKRFFKTENSDAASKKRLTNFFKEPNQQLYRLLAENGHKFSEFRHPTGEENTPSHSKNDNGEVTISEAGKLCCSVSNSRKAAPRPALTSGGFIKNSPVEFCEKVLNGQEIETADFALAFGLPRLAKDRDAQVERFKLRFEQEFPLGLTQPEGNGGLLFGVVLLAIVVVCGGCRTLQKRAWKSE